jgi:hypothetical protein
MASDSGMNDPRSTEQLASLAKQINAQPDGCLGIFRIRVLKARMQQGRLLAQHTPNGAWLNVSDWDFFTLDNQPINPVRS